MPLHLAKTWPSRFLKAIKIGADLSSVWPLFTQYLLVDETYGVLQFAKTEAQEQAIQSVADLYQLQSEGVTVVLDDFMDAREAAADAYAADAYAANADAYAADAYAAAAYAAYAAGYSDADAYTAKRQKVRIAQSEKLLELLKACK